MIGMKRLLTVVTGLIAIEVLLIWLYLGAVLWEGFASAFTGSTAGEAKQALLVGAVSVVIWLGFVWGVDRLVLAVVACVVVT